MLGFGRQIGWSLGEIARVDPGYLLWVEATPEGRRYVEEIDGLLRRRGIRRSDIPTADQRQRVWPQLISASGFGLS